MNNNVAEWGITVDDMMDGNWSFGVCLSRSKAFGELYLFINFFKWSVAIGKVVK